MGATPLKAIYGYLNYREQSILIWPGSCNRDSSFGDVEQKESTMNRLDTIATRQKKSFGRDVLFACFLALAGIVSVTTVSTAAQAAQVAHR
jgi:hypothetical protein